MYCQNCGSKLDENAYVCVNCGFLLKKRSKTKIIRNRNYTKILNIITTIFGSMSVILSLMLFFHDISSVGMYTEIYERIFYAIEYSIFAIIISFVTFILSFFCNKKIYNNIGLILSLVSFFLIFTEFIVVVIY